VRATIGDIAGISMDKYHIYQWITMDNQVRAVLLSLPDSYWDFTPQTFDILRLWGMGIETSKHRV